MRKPRLTHAVALFAAACLQGPAALAAPGDVFYVDRGNGSGVEDGLSWATAFNTIQEGVDKARAAAGGEVWVARGTYGEERGVPTGSVRLQPGVDVYGGFLGTETDRAQRDPVANPTVIDGSKSFFGQPASPVVDAANESVLDGFTIQGGRGVAGPGLICVDGESPTIRRCIFRDNRSLQFGGAVMNIGGSAPRYVGCVFTQNRAGTSGGAVGNTGAAATFIDCTFTLNRAEAAGGAIFNTPDSPVVIEGCRFENNSAEIGGGAIFNEGAEPSISESSFIRNTTEGFGGAIFNNQAADVEVEADCLIINSVLANNSAGRGGGAFATQNSFLTAINCTIVGNSAPRDFGGAFFNNNATTEVSNAIIWYNSDEWIVNLSGSFTEISWSNVGGGDPGPNNIAAEPRFADLQADDFRLLPDSPSIDAGTANGAPSTDIAGNPRPQLDGVDQGAYEAPAKVDLPEGMNCHGENSDGAPLSADTGMVGVVLVALAALRWRRV